MPAADQDRFERLVALMNDVAVGHGAWSDVLEGIRAFLNVSATAIDLVDRKTGEVRLLTSPPLDPGELVEYDEHISRVNPRYSLIPRVRVGEIVADRHMDPEIEAQGGEYYEWLEKVAGTRYFAAVKLHDRPDFLAMTSIHLPASRGWIDEATERLYARLLPDFANALAVERALANREDRLAVVEEARSPSRAYALLDRNGRILECSAEFEAMVRRSEQLTLREGRLGAIQPSDNARLARLIGAVTQRSDQPLGSVRVQPPKMLRGMILRAVRLDRARELFERLRPVAMLVLIDLDAPVAGIAEELRLAWGLTPREADLAILIGQGCALERAAARLDMGEGTARWHLKTIFRKMGIGRQTELAHLVTRLGS